MRLAERPSNGREETGHASLSDPPHRWSRRGGDRLHLRPRACARRPSDRYAAPAAARRRLLHGLRLLRSPELPERNAASTRGQRRFQRSRLLRAALALRVLDVRRSLRASLGPGGRIRLASLLLWSVGPDRLGLDVRLRRPMGLGRLSLRPLELGDRSRLVLDSGLRVGAGMGLLAVWGRVCDLGPHRSGRGRVWLPASGLDRRPRKTPPPPDRRGRVALPTGGPRCPPSPAAVR